MRSFLVPEAGIEPAWPQWPKDFKSFVSTYFTIRAAKKNLLVTNRRFLKQSERRDSNSRPRPWQGRALPTELLPQY